jgi:AraC family transcriptional regulator of arabinose operon
MYYKDSDLVERRTLIHRFIHDRHKQAVRLADLAKALHLSESRAGHLVRDVCGATFLDLLQEARLRSAANLLRHTNLSVLDVATQSGFSEISHFHRHFKKRFGDSPLKYRKQPLA